MPTKDTDKAPAKKKTSVLSTKLRYSTHTITGTVPPIKALTVFDPKDHVMRDGTPVTDKMQEFEGRNLIKRAPRGSKVGDRLKGGNDKNSISAGEKSSKN